MAASDNSTSHSQLVKLESNEVLVYAAPVSMTAIVQTGGIDEAQ